MLTLHSPRKFYEVLVNAMHSGRSSSWCLNVFSKKITHMGIRYVEILTVGRSTRMHCQNLNNINVKFRG